MPSLAELTSPALIFPDLEADTAEGVLRELAGRLSAQRQVRDGEDLFARLWERERLGSTAIGGGVAIPHCKLETLPRLLVAIGVARQGIEFGAPDGQPVRLLFLVVSPARSPAEHLQSLAAISKWVRAGGDVEGLVAGESGEQMYRLIRGVPAAS